MGNKRHRVIKKMKSTPMNVAEQARWEERRQRRAVRWLWRSMIAAAAHAGEDGLDTDDLGYIALEFAVGVLALGYEKDELVAWLELHLDGIRKGGNYCVNLGQVAQGFRFGSPPTGGPRCSTGLSHSATTVHENSPANLCTFGRTAPLSRQ
ncbi:hypothetical protein [Microvirga yunnanensis]|uniref:hypothetical protein n=1 Tax=Microvirga yunnanensis TaxID=2953740 RepID=UPI0021C9D543|nr:hypothetical protein [Microvirga sp. HBU65207]